MSEETESKLVCLLIFRSAGVPVALWLLKVVIITIRCTFPSAATQTLFHQWSSACSYHELFYNNELFSICVSIHASTLISQLC